MKSKKLGHILSIMLCMVMLCSVPAYGAEVRASTQIYQSAVTLSQSNSGNLNIVFFVQATGVMDTIGASSVDIQRYTGSTWVNEYTFTPINTPELQIKNSTMHSATLSYSPLYVEKNYRAVVTIYVKDASGTSVQQLTSRTV